VNGSRYVTWSITGNCRIRDNYYFDFDYYNIELCYDYVSYKDELLVLTTYFIDPIFINIIPI